MCVARISVRLGLLAVLLLAVFALYLTTSSWLGTLFYGYLIIGLLSVTILARLIKNLIKKRKTEASRFSRLLIVSILVEMISRNRWYKKAIAVLALPAPLIVALTAWPSLVIYRILNRDSQPAPDVLQFEVNSDFYSFETFASGYTLFFVVILYFNVYFHGGFIGKYTLILLIMLLAQTTSRDLAYMCRPQSLPVELRRATRYAYLTFASITAMDFVTLSLCISALTIGGSTLSGLLSAGLDLLTLSKAKAIFSNHQVKTVDLVQALVSVIFYMSLFRTLSKVKDFRRTDDDYRSIAYNYLVRGKYNQALSTIVKIRNPVAVTFFWKGASLLGVRQFSKALEAMKKYFDLSSLDASDDAIYSLLLVAFTLIPYNKAIGLKLIDEGMRARVSDICMVGAIGTVDGFAECSEEVASRFSETNVRELYPISTASALLYNKQYSEILPVVSSINATTPFGAMAAALLGIYGLLLGSGIPGSDLAMSLSTWADKLLPIISDVIPLLQSDFEKAFVATHMRLLSIVCRVLIPDRVEEFVFLADAAQQTITSANIRAFMEGLHSKLVPNVLKQIGLKD